jgi:hypothetical protein
MRQIPGFTLNSGRAGLGRKGKLKIENGELKGWLSILELG